MNLLGALDKAIVDLVAALGNEFVEETLTDAGEDIRSEWRANIEAGGLVDTGAYRDSLEVDILHSDEEGVWVQVGTDVRDENGFPYPVALEFGTSEITPKPAGTRAFDAARRRVVKGIGDDIGRKVRSRARR